METFKKVFKVISIIIAILGIFAAIGFAIKKFMDKKHSVADEPENYVSCSCCD